MRSGNFSYHPASAAYVAFAMRSSSHGPHELPSPAGLPSQYEKPTGGGQSNISTEPSFVHAYSLRKSVGTPVALKSGVWSESSLVRSGPSSAEAGRRRWWAGQG